MLDKFIQVLAKVLCFTDLNIKGEIYIYIEV